MKFTHEMAKLHYKVINLNTGFCSSYEDRASAEREFFIQMKDYVCDSYASVILMEHKSNKGIMSSMNNLRSGIVLLDNYHPISPSDRRRKTINDELNSKRIDLTRCSFTTINTVTIK